MASNAVIGVELSSNTAWSLAPALQPNSAFTY